MTGVGRLGNSVSSYKFVWLQVTQFKEVKWGHVPALWHICEGKIVR